MLRRSGGIGGGWDSGPSSCRERPGPAASSLSLQAPHHTSPGSPRSKPSPAGSSLALCAGINKDSEQTAVCKSESRFLPTSLP